MEDGEERKKKKEEEESVLVRVRGVYFTPGHEPRPWSTPRPGRGSLGPFFFFVSCSHHGRGHHHGLAVVGSGIQIFFFKLNFLHHGRGPYHGLAVVPTGLEFSHVQSTISSNLHKKQLPLFRK